jgi:hypothetical protein
MSKRKKYKSAEGVYYWVEPVGMGSKCVVGQKPGYPATEAFKEWLAKEEDADQIAKDISEGKHL